MRVKLTLDGVYCVTAWGKWPVLVGSNRPQHGMPLEIEKPRGDYSGLVLGEYNEKASVCVREDFAGKDSNAVSVNIQLAASGQPIKAVILRQSFCSRQQYLKRQSGVPLRSRRSA
jgi:hypothetical protein